jgi:regulator of sirC expression with transglutaminase-like and TPR domain
MNNNLKAAWIRRGHLEGALRAVNRNLALCPADAAENVDRERILLALSRR